MEIIFDIKPGEVYDCFGSLWILNNYDYVQAVKNDLGIKKITKFDEALEELYKGNNIDIKKLKKYFHKEIEPNHFLELSYLWKCSTVKDYLSFMKKFDKSQVRKKIIKILKKLSNEGEMKNNINGLINDDDSIIKYLDDIEIDSSIKWEIISILHDNINYIKDFTKFIQEYLEIYKSLDIVRKEIIGKFNEYFYKRIKESGIEFLKEVTNNAHNFDIYEKIYITTSVDIGLYISAYEKEKVCYVIIGPRIDEIIEKMSGKNELAKNLIIIKNYTDEIKFKIIKLLLKKECYGLEIGEILGISKVAVSRYMKQLVLSKIVNTRKEGQRIYYYIDKDVLENNIRFLIKELEIDNFKYEI